MNLIGEKYYDCGLRILTISIDRDRENWRKTLQRLKPPGKQMLANYSLSIRMGLIKFLH